MGSYQDDFGNKTWMAWLFKVLISHLYGTNLLISQPSGRRDLSSAPIVHCIPQNILVVLEFLASRRWTNKIARFSPPPPPPLLANGSFVFWGEEEHRFSSDIQLNRNWITEILSSLIFLFFLFPFQQLLVFSKKLCHHLIYHQSLQLMNSSELKVFYH